MILILAHEEPHVQASSTFPCDRLLNFSSLFATQLAILVADGVKSNSPSRLDIFHQKY
jgi:hypothetical protein